MGAGLRLGVGFGDGLGDAVRGRVGPGSVGLAGRASPAGSGDPWPASCPYPIAGRTTSTSATTAIVATSHDHQEGRPAEVEWEGTRPKSRRAGASAAAV